MGGTAFGCAIGLVYYGVMSGHSTGGVHLQVDERAADSLNGKARLEHNAVPVVKQVAIKAVAQKQEARHERMVVQGGRGKRRKT